MTPKEIAGEIIAEALLKDGDHATKIFAKGGNNENSSEQLPHRFQSLGKSI